VSCPFVVIVAVFFFFWTKLCCCSDAHSERILLILASGLHPVSVVKLSCLQLFSECLWLTHIAPEI
jgi:hypothetical protein